MGYNVLGLGDAEYDLAHGSVRLIKPSGCVRADFPFWKDGSGRSELALEPGIGGKTHRIVTTAMINGTKIRVQFDTGAAGSVVSRAAALRAGIDVAALKPSGLSSGFGKHAVKSWLVPVDVFKIGDEEIHKTFLRVIDAFWDGAEAPEMLIGADFFLSHHIYVARDLHKLYFTYNGGNVFNLKAVETLPPVVADAAATPAAGGVDEPVTAEALARRGAASAARHEYGRAIDDLTRAIALAPGEARYLAERAEAYNGNRQPFLAMADLDAVLKLRPGDVPALMMRATARFSGRDKAGARADLDAAATAAPREADVRFTMGQLYERLDALPEAIGQYDLWIAAHHDDVKAARAYNSRCWARALLGTDLKVSQLAVLNANYLRVKVKEFLHTPYDEICRHEFVASAQDLKRETGVKALDIAKALLDHGFHAPTMYFPLLVPECLMIEPTETESKETLDAFVEKLREIVALAKTDTQKVLDAPTTTFVGRIDETRAARQPDLRWEVPAPAV